MSINIYAFYNNKGGVGKTTLCQNSACLFAERNPEKQVIVIDLCPQANISQFLLGGGHVGHETNQKIQLQKTRRNIVGFVDWLIKGNSNFTSIKTSYKVQVKPYNDSISENLYLIAGDSFLEAFSLALNYAVINPANLKAWKEYMTAIRRLCALEFDSKNYKSLTVFIDCNPSFSIYTQMGLVSADRLVLPMMADFSSLEGIKGILMLLYGKYPSSASKNYAEDLVTFDRKIKEFGLPLPQLHKFIFNNFTQNNGVATAYDSIKNELTKFCYDQYKHDTSIFSNNTGIGEQGDWEKFYMSDIKDFHTAGKVSSSLGIPLHKLPLRTKYDMPDGTIINLPKPNYEESLKNIQDFVAKIY